MKKVLAVLLVLVVAAGVFLYFPRGGVADALSNAVLAVLNHGVFGQHGGQAEAPAIDGEVYATGDLVRADADGRAVLTFFDGSTISVEPNSHVRVVSLAKTASGGIQVEVEQTLGRTWASVSKLTGSDSKFVIKTPSMTAVVRGTAFETIVEKQADGTTTTTVKTGEGEVLVQAEAGGEVTVGAGQQVEVEENEPAPPAAEPQPPTPKLRFTAPAGTGFVVVDPRGLRCGATGTTADRQIPRCDVAGGAVLIGDVVAGTYSIVMTAAQAASGNVEAQGLGVSATDFTHRVAVSLNTADLVRMTLPVTLGGGAKLGSSGFTTPELVSTVCGAETPGRVFAGGKIEERSSLLQQFAIANKGQPVAFVVTASEITAAMQEGLAQGQAPVPVHDLAFTIDRAGLHLSAQVEAGPLTIPARANIIVGSVDGKIVVRLQSLDAGIVPDAVKQQIAQAIEAALADAGAEFPFTVQRVALRDGCLAVIGVTPQ
jgi:hypothetical protein